MKLAADILTGLVALLHLYFMVLEMFLWDTAYGRRVFRQSPEQAASSKVLAANQGLYNGFLAAGLVWSLLMGSEGRPVQVFFLGCVVVAGIYGGFTATRKALTVQALPAILALTLVLLT